MTKNTAIGSTLAFLYILLVPLANLAREKFIDKNDSLITLCFAFLYSFLFFNLINLKNINNLYKKCLDNKLSFIKVNMYIITIWGCSFLSPLYLGGTYSVLTLFSMVGLLSSIRLLAEKRFLNKYSIIYIIPIIFYLLSISIIFHDAFVLEKLFGFFLAMSSGVASFLYIKDSQKFSSETNMSASEILAVRYCGIFIILPFVLFLHKGNFTIHLNSHFLFLSLFLSIISMIIPVYFSQKSLSFIDYKLSATIFSFVPCVTWFTYLFQHNPNLNSFSVTVASLFTFLGGITALVCKNEAWYKSLFRIIKPSSRA